MTLRQEDPKPTLPFLMGAMGVVFGDIGTSPLYTIKDCLSQSPYSHDFSMLMGILSLIFWSITSVVSLKYICFVLRADNNGEGGILSLLSLSMRGASDKIKKYLFGIGMIGAALFYGDAVITPAISVLSAVEGLTVVSPRFAQYIVPLAAIILIILFLIQQKGTETIGNLFGPTMTLWFSVIGILGIYQIIKTPQIIEAINPWYAYQFFHDHGPHSLAILGSVVLAITGAEALYTDLGHFGKSVIRRAWLFMVFPCLLLNYFGQGALLLTHPEAASNPFFFLVPSWATLPLVIVATIATVIASQAVISGIFSMTWQAVQLGYLPRLRVDHTSRKTIGHVFVPTMNWSLLLMALMLVILFKSSTALASAYGMAVTGIMVITTFLTSYLAFYNWGWPWWKLIPIFGIFLIIDITYFSVNLMKFTEGGWIPFVIGVFLWAIMTTWKKGKDILNNKIHQSGRTLLNFIKNIEQDPPLRISGNAVYLSSTPDNEPLSLTINLKHNKVLHEKVVILSIITKDVPRVYHPAKILIDNLGDNIYQVVYYVGFTETPNIPNLFEKCNEFGLHLDLQDTTFFTSRGIPVISTTPHLPTWRERLFIFLAKNAMNATEFYKIPYKRVLELGIRIKL
ncbi:MAG: potassium transporter Kup [Candidatus Paracaedibacteraceae bacterium]|nr:potassium transporter Kup [Candidatus Paracaedibacteraceae bacterium]